MAEERWIQHYSSRHAILLVGEGDFSFSVCLALAFGSASNIVATSLDSHDELVKKYKAAQRNLIVLEIMGASLLHGVDATKMISLPYLQCQRFHRIIFNFPHVGFYGKEDNPLLIGMHRDLVRGFLTSASGMLLPDGEIHINHKIKYPYNQWKIDDLAPECRLIFVGCANFSIQDYPGYNNKRGASSRSDEHFELGECRTFIFKSYPTPRMCRSLYSIPQVPPNFQEIPFHVQHQPVLFNFPTSLENVRNECHRTFGGYLSPAEDQSACNATRVDLEPYAGAVSGSSVNGYFGILKEHHLRNIVKLELLRQRLYRLDQ